MTARDHVKRAVRVDRSDADRAPAEPVPSLPERLYAARERKGVDLYRAERDTKIRARYLGALERGDYKELPGAVYTKGFLRNYALYLGLDPEDVLLQWRRERGEIKDAAPAIVVRRPITAPSKGLTFSPGIVVAALLTVVVIAFGAYLAIQVLRFTKPPTIAVTSPATAVIDVADSTSTYTLAGTTLPNATVQIVTPGRDPYRVTALSDGQWSTAVDLRRGRNQFDVSAIDPDTGKQSDSTVRIFITVPLLQAEAPGPTQTLTVDQPAEGGSFQNGAITVAGKAPNATSVVVGAAWVGSSGPATPAGKATPAPPATPAQATVPVAKDGTFGTPYQLGPGRWTLTVTARSADGTTSSVTRHVTVAAKGITLAITAKGGRAWIKVWVDGKIDPGVGTSGQVIANGKTLTFTGRQSIEVRTGSSGVTAFTMNGTSLGSLGKSGVPETWLFAPPAPPEKTKRR
jgi:cytoskeletal protein RodZ